MTRLPPGLGFTHPAACIATVCGVGLLPRTPGTFGSLVALPAAWALHVLFGAWGIAAAAAVAFVAGIWAAGVYNRAAGIQDPGSVVIDELAAQLFVLATVAPDPVLYGLAFLTFRFFDIVKPFPISWADRTIKGGIGTMVDDLLAAIYAGAATKLIELLLIEA